MIPATEIAIRLAVAALLGGLVGLERERREAAAGLRTHALVGLGAALFMIASAFGFGDILGTEHVALDPSRIAAQVVSGIGFLGAGAIINRADKAKGLTTAAGIWFVAAIGLAVGGGLYIAAVLATAFALVILVVLKLIERKFERKARGRTLCAIFDPTRTSVGDIVARVEKQTIAIRRLRVQSIENPAVRQLELEVDSRDPGKLQTLTAELGSVPGVSEARYLGR